MRDSLKLELFFKQVYFTIFKKFISRTVKINIKQSILMLEINYIIKFDLKFRSIVTKYNKHNKNKVVI